MEIPNEMPRRFVESSPERRKGPPHDEHLMAAMVGVNSGELQLGQKEGISNASISHRSFQEDSPSTTFEASPMTGASPARHEQNEQHYHHPHEVAGIYAPMLRLRQKRDMDITPMVPLPSRTIGGLRDQIEKSKQCNCKRSHCLKLYCECFASGIHCSIMCNCTSCRNNEDPTNNHGGDATTTTTTGEQFSQHRTEAILGTLERNPHAFRPRPLAIAGAAARIGGGDGGGVGGGRRRESGNVNEQQQHQQQHQEQQQGSSNCAPNTPNTISRVSVGVGVGAKSPTTAMGCHCKKSFCLKKYCECFQAAVYCSSVHCKCRDCQNVAGNPTRERLVAKRRHQAEAAAAAAALAHQHNRFAQNMSGRMVMMGDAGRTYYEGPHHTSGTTNSGGGLHHGKRNSPLGSSPQKKGGIMMMGTATTTAAAAVAAGAAAGGVNVFLPPFSYTTPMLQTNGEPFPGLSFGNAEISRRGGENADDVGLPSAPGSPPKLKRRKNNNADESEAAAGTASSQPMLQSALNDVRRVETDLERKWREETEFVDAIYDTINEELLEGNHAADLTKMQSMPIKIILDDAGEQITTDPKNETATAPNVKEMASEMLHEVLEELKYLKRTVEGQAEREKKKQQQQQQQQNISSRPNIEPKEKGNDDDDSSVEVVSGGNQTMMQNGDSASPLAALEQLAPDALNQKLSAEATEELRVLAVQDAALLVEVARIIKHRALLLGEARIRRLRQNEGSL